MSAHAKNSRAQKLLFCILAKLYRGCPEGSFDVAYNESRPQKGIYVLVFRGSYLLNGFAPLFHCA